MSKSAGNLRAPLAIARGLGSAKYGAEHWWAMRLSSVALIVLSFWFVCGVVSHLGADYAAFVAWMKSPVSATMMVLTAIVAFHHAADGLQVVIEDYVHCEVMKIASLIAVKLVCYGLATACVVSVIKISLGA